ncbi:MAG TPA: lytic transglycosylase domain-containing protein [Gaiellaceae bacterium]
MRRRLLALLIVALISGIVAGTVASAKGRLETAPARIPPLPALREVANTCPVPAAYRPVFARAAHDTGPPLAMLVAVGQVESNLRADARSSADARGLLQVLPSTAAALRLDADRPDSNVLAGARYLDQLLQRFHSTDLALAAYNAGPTAVAEADGAATQETLDYVANVTALWRELRGCR